jgi:hypothetical protein
VCHACQRKIFTNIQEEVTMNSQIRRFSGVVIALLLACTSGESSIAQWIQPEPGPVLKLTSTATGATKINDNIRYTVALHNTTTDALNGLLVVVLSPAVEPREVRRVFTAATGAEITETIAVSPTQRELRLAEPLLAGSRVQIVVDTALTRCLTPILATGNASIGTIASYLAPNTVLSAATAFVPTGCVTGGTPRPTPGPLPTPQPTVQPPAGPDVDIKKSARLHPDFDVPGRGWIATWLVAYGNRGDTTAASVSIVDTLGGNQSVLAVRSAPLVTPTQLGTVFTFPVGELGSRRRGGILLRTGVPFTTTAGTQLINQVSITAALDANPANNTSAVTLTVPALPPLITWPRNGVTCSGTLTVTGLAQAGAEVTIRIDGAVAATVTTGTDGKWQLPVSLDQGEHVFLAATAGQRMSPPVFVRVNAELPWDPISLTFTDTDGSDHPKHLRHWRGWVDSSGWYVGLSPGTTYTLAVRLCCTDPNATVSVTIPGAAPVVLSDPDGDRRFSGVVSTSGARQMLADAGTVCVAWDGRAQCWRGRVILANHEGRRHWVTLGPAGFEPSRLSVAVGDIVEIVNMAEDARLLRPGSMRTPLSTHDSVAYDSEAVRLEPGESYAVEIRGARAIDWVDEATGAPLSVNAGNAVYVPLIRR